MTLASIENVDENEVAAMLVTRLGSPAFIGLSDSAGTVSAVFDLA